jgi:arylsulfatase A-like enzyme
VRWPGTAPAGATRDALVAHTDWLATFAELLGRPLARDAGEDSFSFLPALDGRTATRPARTALVHDSNGGRFALRDGDWKLLLAPDGGALAAKPDPAAPPVQLFNLRADPAETRNLAATEPARVAQLQARLAALRASPRTAPP